MNYRYECYLSRLSQTRVGC